MGQLSLTYRTFDDLLNDILVDLRVVDEEGMIEPSQLIKIAQRVNYDLGVRIHQTKEMVLDISNGTAKLPEDFYILNFALLTEKQCRHSDINYAGRTTEQVNVPCSGDTCCLVPLTYQTNCLNPNANCNNGFTNPKDTCTPEWDPWFQRSCFSVCGSDNCVKVYEKKGHHYEEYTYFEQLYIAPQKYLDPGSLNSKMVNCGTAEIKNGYLYVHGKRNCKVFISYEGALEDENGNLLVLDHPEINHYYEYALKERILENLWYAGEEVKQKLDYTKQEKKIARAQALSIVNMPNFQEMQAVFQGNRQAQWKKYYRTFETGVFNSWFRTLPF